jgi:Cytochrome P460
MLRSMLLLLLLAVLPQQGQRRQLGALPTPRAVARDVAAAEGPNYTASGELKMPERYREWIFLTSGVDMSYSPNAAMAGHSMFDNVFVNPAAYRTFQETGTWPDKTTLVLEIRGAEGASSINKRGHTQSPEIMGMEVHVKDAKLEGGWGFYEFDGSVSAKVVKRPASCYECHENHAAVDTTFVQFYPTLIGLAKTKGTLSAAYLKEMSAPAESK